MAPRTEQVARSRPCLMIGIFNRARGERRACQMRRGLSNKDRRFVVRPGPGPPPCRRTLPGAASALGKLTTIVGGDSASCRQGLDEQVVTRASEPSSETSTDHRPGGTPPSRRSPRSDDLTSNRGRYGCSRAVGFELRRRPPATDLSTATRPTTPALSFSPGRWVAPAMDSMMDRWAPQHTPPGCPALSASDDCLCW